MNYSVFVLMTAAPAWLSLSREQRNDMVANTLEPLLREFGATVRVRLFDAEAFTARCSDVMMLETEDLKSYYYFIEKLRDTALIAHPYFIVNDIIPAIENGFRTFEAETSKQ
ncbi:darcynin-like uncharacterized protein [Thermosporothrix hazakensis]|jgi:hypothetical protein|uniref:Darcynin-like uncharacterized protein n=1 Tax=Thermosporothrix hazakensis TaxID=644383 RepID=A0A326UAE9_THEHA|nr:darcynin family protein [Thermosporothrix hazakensis]PZW32628.1 darcynin-like uncharacterized protein [Thermosporothrix hazakensis]GCE49981.1 hypothetical protein KTH_48500 [Thermosporothrix hazakensis]